MYGISDMCSQDVCQIKLPDAEFAGTLKMALFTVTLKGPLKQKEPIYPEGFYHRLLHQIEFGTGDNT